jgi:hypothetical protein
MLTVFVFQGMIGVWHPDTELHSLKQNVINWKD